MTAKGGTSLLAPSEPVARRRRAEGGGPARPAGFREVRRCRPPPRERGGFPPAGPHGEEDRLRFAVHRPAIAWPFPRRHGTPCRRLDVAGRVRAGVAGVSARSAGEDGLAFVRPRIHGPACRAPLARVRAIGLDHPAERLVLQPGHKPGDLGLGTAVGAAMGPRRPSPPIPLRDPHLAHVPRPAAHIPLPSPKPDDPEPLAPPGPTSCRTAIVINIADPTDRTEGGRGVLPRRKAGASAPCVR